MTLKEKLSKLSAEQRKELLKELKEIGSEKEGSSNTYDAKIALLENEINELKKASKKKSFWENFFDTDDENKEE